MWGKNNGSRDKFIEEEKISKKDLDNLSDNTKVGVMAAAKINYDK